MLDINDPIIKNMIEIIILFFLLMIFALIFYFYLLYNNTKGYTDRQKKKENTFTKCLTDSITETTKHFDRYHKIKNIMSDIERKLEKEYKGTYLKERWENFYKEQILSIISIYISEESEKDLIKILEIFQNSLNDEILKEKETKINIELDILKSKLKMDGIDNSDFS